MAKEDVCSLCGSSSPNVDFCSECDTTVCEDCGTFVSDYSYCPDCYEGLPKSSCLNCGEEITALEAQTGECPYCGGT